MQESGQKDRKNAFQNAAEKKMNNVKTFKTAEEFEHS